LRNGKIQTITEFPSMDNGFMSLFAASHVIYLSYKAVPHT
jgi:hypothetical protein